MSQIYSKTLAGVFVTDRSLFDDAGGYDDRISKYGVEYIECATDFEADTVLTRETSTNFCSNTH
jgi:predicted glycosyltransferase involved in capsule biosynthesis